jgi:hypothetical protein
MVGRWGRTDSVNKAVWGGVCQRRCLPVRLSCGAVGRRLGRPRYELSISHLNNLLQSTLPDIDLTMLLSA